MTIENAKTNEEMFNQDASDEIRNMPLSKIAVNPYERCIEWLDSHGITTIGDTVDHLRSNGNFFYGCNAHNFKYKTIYLYNLDIINLLKNIGYTIKYIKNNSDDDEELYKESWIIEGFKSPKFKTANDLTVIIVTNDYKPIRYGDGYDKHEFVFNRNITEEEFYDFLNTNNYNLHSNPVGWWDDYSKIEGCDNKWTYTWIRRYTD